MRLTVPELASLRCACGSAEITAIKVGYEGDAETAEVTTLCWCIGCWIHAAFKPRRPRLFDGNP